MPLLTRWTYRLTLAAVLLVLGAAGGIWLMRQPSLFLPRFTESDIEQVVITTLQRETPAAFLVTGRLDITADITEANTKYLFPEYFDESLSLGTTRSTVRLPGVAAYGIDLSSLSPETIAFTSDSVLVITVSGIQIESVEPDLGGMMVQTEVGWARLSARSGRNVERRAIIAAQDALREEAVAHIERSGQPLLNTEMALQRLLVPALQSVGVQHPQVRVRIAPTIVEPPR
ncbi:MAG: DUF4230 domain-containing protein [Rhodothermales bacterium]